MQWSKSGLWEERKIHVSTKQLNWKYKKSKWKVEKFQTIGFYFSEEPRSSLEIMVKEWKMKIRCQQSMDKILFTTGKKAAYVAAWWALQWALGNILPTWLHPIPGTCHITGLPVAGTKSLFTQVPLSFYWYKFNTMPFPVSLFNTECWYFDRNQRHICTMASVDSPRHSIPGPNWLSSNVSAKPLHLVWGKIKRASGPPSFSSVQRK